MKLRTAAAFVLLGPALYPAALSAHDVPVERTVEMYVLPQDGALTVLLRLPAAVLADARLPRRPGGYLDLEALDRPLGLVAASVASNLELREDDIALPQPSVVALVVSMPADTSFTSPETALAHLHGPPLPADQLVDGQRGLVDLELRFPSIGPGRLSARLNAFRAPGQAVRTEARYRLASGELRTMSVAGPPERVTFDPDAIEVAQRFVQRALTALLDGGDHLFFLICLLIPVREARSLIRLCAAMGAGQLLAIAAGAFGPPLSADVLACAGMIAASALLVAALQNLVGARDASVWMLGLLFGALDGLGFGRALSVAAPFAGSHGPLAAALFALVVAAGEIWIAALLWATRTWLDERGLPRQTTTVVLSIWIAHTAIHRMIDGAELLEQSGLITVERAVVLLALAWMGAMVGVSALPTLGGASRDRGARTAEA